MKQTIIILAMLVMGNSYGMNMTKEDSDPQEISALAQLPNDLKRSIIEFVLYSNNLSQALKNLNALARTSKIFAELLADASFKAELTKNLIIKLSGCATKKRFLGQHLGVVSEQWFIDYCNEENFKIRSGLVPTPDDPFCFGAFFMASNNDMGYFQPLV